MQSDNTLPASCATQANPEDFGSGFSVIEVFPLIRFDFVGAAL